MCRIREFEGLTITLNRKKDFDQFGETKDFSLGYLTVNNILYIVSNEITSFSSTDEFEIFKKSLKVLNINLIVLVGSTVLSRYFTAFNESSIYIIDYVNWANFEDIKLAFELKLQYTKQFNSQINMHFYTKGSVDVCICIHEGKLMITSKAIELNKYLLVKSYSTSVSSAISQFVKDTLKRKSLFAKFTSYNINDFVSLINEYIKCQETSVKCIYEESIIPIFIELGELLSSKDDKSNQKLILSSNSEIKEILGFIKFMIKCYYC